MIFELLEQYLFVLVGHLATSYILKNHDFTKIYKKQYYTTFFKKLYFFLILVASQLSSLCPNTSIF